MSPINNLIYVFILNSIRGIEAPEQLQIIKLFPSLEALSNASDQLLTDKLGRDLSQKLSSDLLSIVPTLSARAQSIINEHLEKGISVIPITDPIYPPLLKLISDPPIIIYCKGNAMLLKKIDAVAVVGTRTPTTNGKNIAKQIAKYFSEKGFTIVGGLAKGIDTTAHEAALDVNGNTIAVLATPLNKIYPAENKSLSERICDNSGAVITEIALGRSTNRFSFIQRDRIQSGLSLGVIPVQTDIEGGTMHTVKFGEQQKRLIFCPSPLKDEIKLKENAGIVSLIRSGRATGFSSNDMAKVFSKLNSHKTLLVPNKDMIQLPLMQTTSAEVRPEKDSAPKHIAKEKPKKSQKKQKIKSKKDNLPLHEEK
jgi:DNA processing protein